MRSAASQVAQCKIFSVCALPSPSAALCAAMISMRQSPNFECVFHMPPASLTSFPMCPMSSAPRKPSSLQSSRLSPIKFDVSTALFESRPKKSRI